jgi:hypothetical protein
VADEQTTPQAGEVVEQQATPAVAAANVPAAEKPTAATPETETMTLAEAQKLRRESQKLRERIKALEEYERQAEEAAKAQGEWQGLAEKYEPKAKRADALEKFVGALLDDELKAVPEKVKALIPDFDDALKTLEWVRTAKAAGVLATPQAPRTDAAASANGANAGNASLYSEEERRQIAARYGLRLQDVPAERPTYRR